MTNNDVLRRIRFTFNYSDSQMMAIFSLADKEVSRSDVCSWLKNEEQEDYLNCSDVLLATFLNGLINKKRGKREGKQPAPENRITNNIILMKLKIALNLKAEDILNLLEQTNFRLSKHELSAFFRKPSHKHFRPCKDQILRNFLNGIELQYRT